MPSFINHTRHHTWPPSFHLLDLSLLSAPAKAKPLADMTSLPDIDEDPFAHFITPVTVEDDPYDVLSLSAGILPSEPPDSFSKAYKFKTSVAKRWARYMARNHQQLHRDDRDRYGQNDIPRIMEPEGDSMYRDRNGRTSRLEVREPTRGRAQDLLTPERRRRGRRVSRTLSGHRHSWREPSPELFTVSEEEEAAPIVRAEDGESRRSQAGVVQDSVGARAKL